MAEEQRSQEQQKKNFTLNLVQVLDLGCGILHQAFVKQPADKAKLLLKDLKNGKRISLGAMTLSQKDEAGEVTAKLEMPLFLELDYSEFKGGFNYPAFNSALRGLLDVLATTMRAKKDLNILTNEQTGGALIHRPSIIQDKDGQLNVLVISIEPAPKDSVILRLMFVDPTQYDEYRKDKS